MKKQMFVLASIVTLLLAGCVVTSVHPFYTTKDLSYEPALLGQWTNTTANEHWTFQKEGSDAYHLVYVSEEGKTNLATVHLFKLGSQPFLDFFSADADCPVLPPAIPSHLLLRVTQLSPTVRLSLLNHDWLQAALEKDPKLLRHAMVGGKPDDQRVVLTADIAELQQFLRAHLDTPQAWQEPFELKRVQ